MNHAEAIAIISHQLGLTTDAGTMLQKEVLAEKINDLLLHDFDKLISILYRMDVSEKKLRDLLQQEPETDAGMLIAGLMIDRQEQKIISRNQFKSKNENIDDDDKW